MNAKITCWNGFKARKALLKAAEDPRVDEIEGEGMDEGRVFIHLKKGFWFPLEGTHLRGVGDAKELKEVLESIEVEP